MFTVAMVTRRASHLQNSLAIPCVKMVCQKFCFSLLTATISTLDLLLDLPNLGVYSFDFFFLFHPPSSTMLFVADAYTLYH